MKNSLRNVLMQFSRLNCKFVSFSSLDKTLFFSMPQFPDWLNKSNGN